MRYLSIFCLSLLFLSFSTVAKTQEIKDEEFNKVMNVLDSFSSIPQILRRNILYGRVSAKEQYISLVMGFLRKNGVDMVKLTIDDLEVKQRQALLSVKKKQISEVLNYDDNLDGKVTFDEIDSFFANNKSNINVRNSVYAKRKANDLKKLDISGDSIISHEEMQQLSDERKEQAFKPIVKNYKQYLALDPNKDGILTGNELEMIAIKTFALFDKNGDGIISVEEKKPYLDMKQTYGRVIMSKEQCPLPKVDDNLKLLVVSAYEGAAISTVTAAGQDKETRAVKVKIGKDQPPAYLVLVSFRPTMWKLEGDIDAIKKVVVAGGFIFRNTKSGSGVIGLDKDKVVFAKQDCIPFFSDKTSRKIYMAKGAIRALTGKIPYEMNGAYSVREVNISDSKITFPIRRNNIPASPKAIVINPGDKPVISGRLESTSERLQRLRNRYKIYIPPAPEGYDKMLWERFIKRHSGGIVKIDPAKVVSDAKVENYELLPGLAGIMELIRDGYMEKVDYDNFRIIKDITKFPIGLASGGFITFTVAKGVKIPQISVGRFCVIMEETGEIIGNKIVCR